MSKDKTVSFIKNIAAILAFLLIVSLLMNILALFFVPKKDRMETSYRPSAPLAFTEEQKNTIDTMIFGHSSVYSAISPMEFWGDYGFTAYSSGKIMGTLPEIYKNFELSLQYQSPTVVVLEADTVFYGKTKSTSPKKIGNGLKKIKELIFDYDDTSAGSEWLQGIGFFFPFITYHKRWAELGKKDFKNFDEAGRFVGRGYSLSGVVDPYNGDSEYMEKNKVDPVIPEANLALLEKMVELCKKNGIEFVIIAIPQVKTWSNGRHDSVSAFAKEHDLTFLDYNLMCDSVGFDWKMDTRDAGSHTNSFGGEKFSAHLGTYLKERYNLPDHRKDPAYAEWNKDYEVYETDRTELFKKSKKVNLETLEKTKEKARSEAKKLADAAS